MANEVRIKASVTDDVSGSLSKIRDKFDLLGKGAASSTAIGVLGAKAMATGFGLVDQAASSAIGFVEDSIKAASDLNETLQKSSVVFGTSADDIKAWGATAAKSMGLSENAAIGAAASIGNLLLSTGTAKEKIAPMSEGIVKLASDLASFNNIPVEDALAKLQSGLVGQERPLRELGVAISAAAVDAEAANLGFQKVNGTFTEGEKVQARYSLIFKQTGTAQGDFARTSDQMANQQRILQAELEDTSAKFGTALIPTVIQAQREFINLFNAIELVQGGFSKNADEAAGQAKSVFDLAGAFGFLLPGMGQLADASKALVDQSVKVTDAYNANTDAVHDMRTKEQADQQALIGDTEHFQRSIVASYDKSKNAVISWQDQLHKSSSAVIRDQAKVRDALAGDAQSIIDTYFNPIEERGKLHETRMQVLADEDAARTAKTKEASRQAKIALIQDLDDEASSLVALGQTGSLTKQDIDNFATDAKKAYGKIPPAIQSIIDHLTTLAKLPNVSKTITITEDFYAPTKIPTVLVKNGYFGNTDIVKRGIAHARGGPVKPGEVYTVGEEGPETFVSDKAGTIIPHGGSVGATSGGAWSQPTVVNFAVTVNASSGMTPGDARALASAIGPALYADMQRKGLMPRAGTGLRG